MAKPLPLLDLSPTAAICCAPLAEAALTAGEAVALAARMKALADPARLRLLSILLANENQQACTCDLTGPLGLSQPTVTHHLHKLHEAGLVTAERRGVWTYYRVLPEALGALAAVLTPTAVPAAPR
jgi:ArsR family transcriptional regulator, arsenate/arsenite/antimonite-responsive transcriptional repressor